MALHGKNSKVQKGTDRIAETNDWSIDIDIDLVELPLHQSEWMTRLAGLKDWTATIDANLDFSAAQQTIVQNLLIGTVATATWRFYVNATSYYSGPGYVESQSMSGPADDVETITFNIACDGTLTYNAS